MLGEKPKGGFTMEQVQLTQLNSDVPAPKKDYFGEVGTLLKLAGINGKLTKEEYVAFCSGNYVVKGDKYNFLNMTKEDKHKTPIAIYKKVINLLATSKSSVRFSFGKFITYTEVPVNTTRKPAGATKVGRRSYKSFFVDILNTTAVGITALSNKLK